MIPDYFFIAIIASGPQLSQIFLFNEQNHQMCATGVLLVARVGIAFAKLASANTYIVRPIEYASWWQVCGATAFRYLVNSSTYSRAYKCQEINAAPEVQKANEGEQ